MAAPAADEGRRIPLAAVAGAHGIKGEVRLKLFSDSSESLARHSKLFVGGIPRRLLAVRDRLDEADCLVVVAGMEGALPSVVGGLTGVPLVAVPTSVGYGASFGGLAALLAMLNSCAPGVTVVNIDNGYGAAVHAARVARNAGPRTT